MPIPLPTITDTYRCALRWKHTASSQTAVNVIHLFNTDGAGNEVSAFAALDASVDASMFDALSGGAAVLEVDITKLDGSSATQTFATGSPAKWSGVATGDFVPQVAILVKEQTLLRGRDNRGRIFLPFVTEGRIAAGALDLTTQGIMQTAWTDFKADLLEQTPPFALTVASYDRRHAGAGAHQTEVLAVTVEVETATQRKRQTRNR